MQLPTDVELTSHRPGIGGLIVAYKKLVRRLISPYLTHVIEKIWGKILHVEERLGQGEKRLDELEDRYNQTTQPRLNELAAELSDMRAASDRRLAELSDMRAASDRRLAALEQHLPTLLNHLASFANTSRMLKRGQADIWQAIHEVNLRYDAKFQEESVRIEGQNGRMEEMRKEILYELRYGKKAGEPETSSEPRITAQDKIRKMAGALKVNVGCGHKPVEGYINADKRELESVDVVAEAGNLPFEPESLAEVFSSHLVEHFPEEEFKRVILPHWRGLLKKGGVLRAVLPDWETMISKYSGGEYPFEKLRLVTFGAQDYDGDFHYNMFSRTGLTSMLEKAGFINISFPVVGRINGDCYEMEVTAEKA